MNNYFYANDAEAALYDDTISLTQPEYESIHSIAAQLIHRSLGLPSSRAKGKPINVLDIGAGTGNGILPLLALIPSSNVVAFDLSDEMLAVLKTKTLSDGPRQKVTCVLGDILDPKWDANTLCSLIEGQRFDVILSGFLIHHFTATQRQELYRRFQSMLCEGGIFVNVDLFDFQSPTLSQYAEEVGENWVSEQLSSHSRQQYRETVNKLGPKANELRTKWIAHLRNENIPGPIESSGEAIASKATTSELLSIPGNSQLLIQSGFQEVGCPYRYWQAGILWAKK